MLKDCAVLIVLSCLLRLSRLALNGSRQLAKNDDEKLRNEYAFI
jgi:hypothetical protein